MGHVVAVQVVDSGDDLLEVEAGLFFWESAVGSGLLFVFDYLAEQFSFLEVLGHQQQTFLGFNDFVEVHDVSVADFP